MADNKPLTRMQRRILYRMGRSTYARFLSPHAPGSGGARSFNIAPTPAATPDGDPELANEFLTIHAYQTPAWFLRSRGFIVACREDKFGVWYRLTNDGKRRAAKIKEEPR